MDALHQLEILWILILQNLGAWLAAPMRLVSMLGQEEFFMLIMPALYWSVDSALGLRLGIMLLLSNGLNCIIKLAFHSPRPYWFDSRVRAFAAESSFGLPSGHSQTAAGLWGLLAWSQRYRWVKIVFVLVVFLIGFSRVFLGVHFISDVLLGWLLGGLMVWVFLKVEKTLGAWLKARSLAELVAAALVTSVILALSIILSTAALGSWQVPAAWAQVAKLAPLENVIDPLNLEGAFTISGTWFGLMAGAAWFYCRRGGFSAAGAPIQRLLRYIIGVAGIFAFWYVLGSVISRVVPPAQDALNFALRYLRYSLVGLWISALAPLVFERANLIPARSKEVAPLYPRENPL